VGDFPKNVGDFPKNVGVFLSAAQELLFVVVARYFLVGYLYAMRWRKKLYLDEFIRILCPIGR